MYRPLRERIATLESQFAQLPEARRDDLARLADFVVGRRSVGEVAQLIFICTHNSRRSHLAQLWAWAAAAHFGVDGVETFSGGTEVTALHPNVVVALSGVGFWVEPEFAEGTPSNPRYRFRYASDGPELVCYSKLYDAPENPRRDFAAVMTCDHADQNCPLVMGAATRLLVSYQDPKLADGTPAEADQYRERCLQVGREMLYAFSLVTA